VGSEAPKRKIEMAQEEIIIQAENRTVKGKQVKALRRAGILPGVIYGRHLEAFPIQMNAHEASLKLSKLSSSSLITIDVEGKTHAVIVRDRQRDPIYGRLIHIDFLAVSLTELLRTNVRISLTGEAPVSKLADVVILHNLYELEIECLPSDLPSKIEVDISGLTSMDDNITVADLKLGEKVTILTDPEEVIVSVSYAQQQAVTETEATAEPEVAEKGKKETEE